MPKAAELSAARQNRARETLTLRQPIRIENEKTLQIRLPTRIEYYVTPELSVRVEDPYRFSARV